MKKNIFIFGLISGLIVTSFMVYSVDSCYRNSDFEGNKVLGYAGMFLAFSFIFIAIKNFRDKQQQGSITFGKAFTVGVCTSLVASTIYVVVWLIYFYGFIPDFMDKYTLHVLKEAKESGASALEIQGKVKEMDNFKEMYKNPIWVVLITYSEVLPVGLIISLISAFILRKKPVQGHQ